jgi:hydrogenase 3 maturation protease
MTTLKNELQRRLRGAKKIAVLGVGSELRGDDAAGIFVCRLIAKKSAKIIASRKLKVFIGLTAPENLTGAIRRFKPTHLIIVDCAKMGKAAGTIRFIDPDDAASAALGTHNMPLKVLADYLTQTIGCAVAIIGIQPQGTFFGKQCSRPVARAVRQFAELVHRVIDLC